MLTKKELILENKKGNKEDNLLELGFALDQLKKTKIKVTFMIEDDSISQAKKRYFAMVTELGKYLGYQSHKDRELFKLQIKEHLGNESIADMQDYDQIRIKIEELHQFAINEHHYLFPSHDSGLFFNDFESNG
jgi:hypothetical protein